MCWHDILRRTAVWTVVPVTVRPTTDDVEVHLTTAIVPQDVVPSAGVRSLDGTKATCPECLREGGFMSSLDEDVQIAVGPRLFA